MLHQVFDMIAEAIQEGADQFSLAFIGDAVNLCNGKRDVRDMVEHVVRKYQVELFFVKRKSLDVRRQIYKTRRYPA